MSSAQTSLAEGTSWLPRIDVTDGFVERFTNVFEKFHSRDLTVVERDAWRDGQLKRVLAKVNARSPFYHRQLAGIDLDAVSPTDLSTLPFTTKTDLRREMFDVLSGGIEDACYFYETTGTTGRATPCPRDMKEAIASNAHITESWRAIFRSHFSDRRPRVGLMGPTEVHSFGDTLGDVAKNVGSCNAKIWPYSPVIGFKKSLELIRDLKLEVIVATPGVCLNLARAAKVYGFDMEVDFASLKLCFVTGEMCTPALAANINSIWNVSTYNILYGSQEAFVMGVAAPSGAMKLADTNYIVEIIDVETGEVLGERGTGELCVTMLTDGIKPLIRYRTGDLVTITDDQHVVGDQPGPILQVIGRVLDRIEIGGRTITAGELEQSVLEGVSKCYGYQVLLDSDASGDQITVRLQLEQPAGAENLTRRLSDRISATFGVPVEVQVVEDLDQIVSTGAFVSWKAARIVDNRRERDHEERVAAELGQRRGIAT